MKDEINRIKHNLKETSHIWVTFLGIFIVSAIMYRYDVWGIGDGMALWLLLMPFGIIYVIIIAIIGRNNGKMKEKST